MKFRSSWLYLVGILVVIGLAFDLITRSRLSATTVLQCQGEYGDNLQLQSMRTRELEQGPRGQYSYLVRSTARYECPFFGADGKLRRRRIVASELGSAFAYEVSGNETFLLTNEHVASWPEVTDPSRRVDGVPDGCKRVDDKLRIVRDERDDFEPGQIPLTRVAVDPLLDAAVLKAPQALNVIPYKIGKSASVRQGNAIRVRGFPLGVMQAVSDGKIVNPYDRDQEQGWDHVDFVVDALLSEGNSGSPVLAVSCATRELELIGMYHAGYKGHSALNVVVGIDQLVEFMRRKKRVPRTLSEGGSGLDAKDRARLVEALGNSSLPFFDFGGTTVRVDAQGADVRYHFYGRQFPLDDRRMLVIEDVARDTSKDGARDGTKDGTRDGSKDGAFGEIGRIFIPGPSVAAGQGPWRAWPPVALGTDERDLVVRAVDSLRIQVLRTLDYRRTLSNLGSADDRRRGRDLSRSLARDAIVARDLASSLIEMTERLSVGHDTPAPPAGAASENPSPPGVPPGPPPLAPVSTATPLAP